jgi:xylulokinase
LTTRQPIFDPQRRTFNFAHLDPDLYFPIGTMQAAGGSYSWLEELYRRDQDGNTLFASMDAAAKAVPPGANGVLFLPYLLGERSPYWNPFARAAFIGLAMSHGWAEMSRAVLEGVAFNLRLILDTLRAQGIQIEAMRLIGGGARSPLWRQILADVFQLPIHLPSLPLEATALGAVIAGGVGVGLFPDYNVASRLIPASEAEQPDAANRSRYDALYQLFQQSYVALEPVFARLAKSEAY